MRSLRKKLINNHEVNFENLIKIFENVKISTAEEIDKYAFIILCNVYEYIYGDNEIVASNFKLFYWVRHSRFVADFYKQIETIKINKKDFKHSN